MMVEIMIGILATVAIGLGGWALTHVVAQGERLRALEARVGESSDDGMRGMVAALTKTVERLSDAIERLDRALERLEASGRDVA
jgi:uncharacterized lipoprotein YmbA